MSLHEFYEHLRKQVDREIRELANIYGEEYFIEVDKQQLKKYIYKKFVLPIVEKDNSREIQIIQQPLELFRSIEEFSDLKVDW